MSRVAALLLSVVMVSPEGMGATSTKDQLRERLERTYTAAAKWLIQKQDDTGAWQTGPPGRLRPSPAYTALCITALSKAPKELRESFEASIDAGVRFLLTKANLDGSFGEGPGGTFMKTYTTAVCLLALSSVEQTDRIADAVRGAQAYLKRNQLTEGVYRGGLGYGDEEPKRDPETGKFVIKRNGIPNLSASAFATEAMYESGFSMADPFWKDVLAFTRKCQNNSETNSDPTLQKGFTEKGLSVGDDGGFFYAPTPERSVHKAGTVKRGDRESIVSYGAMSYDGIKTFLYAGLAKDAPEVKAAIGWVRRNYSLTTHPGFPYDTRRRHHLRGIYYYYLVLTRALHAYGETPFKTSDGRLHDWPREVAAQLLNTVRKDNTWKNDNPAWYEGDSLLVTAYVLNVSNTLFQYLR